MKKVFIFDMDGVIIDTQGLHSQAAQQALAEFGVQVTFDEVQAYAGTAGVMVYHELAQRYGKQIPLDEVLARKQKIFTGLMVNLEREGKFLPIDGIPALLKELQAKHIPTAIASSSSDAFIAQVVDTLKLRPYFQALLSGRDLPHSKPDPAIYLLAAKTLGVAPQEAVVLEDAGMGVLAAKRAGAYCIGFRNPNSGQQDLSRADEIVHSIREINVQKLFAREEKK